MNTYFCTTTYALRIIVAATYAVIAQFGFEILRKLWTVIRIIIGKERKAKKEIFPFLRKISNERKMYKSNNIGPKRLIERIKSQLRFYSSM